MARWAMDLRPLRRPRFRVLWAGSLFSVFASQVTIVLVAKHVYDLTGSSLAVGLVAAVELVPLMVLAMVGGAIADAFDRRRVVLLAEAGQVVCALALGLDVSRPNPHLWLTYLLAAVIAGLSSISTPARWAITPRLVPVEEFTAASALESLSANAGAIAGPALAGIGIAVSGVAPMFFVVVALYVGSLVSMAVLGPVPPTDTATAVSLQSIIDGFRFLKGRQTLQGTYLLDFNAMIFGMPMALFPALAAERFGDSDVALGLLYAAPSVGALLGTVTSGWTGRVHRHGLAIVLAVVAWGAAITLFAVPAPLWLALVLVGLAGWADLVSVVFRKVIWSTVIPDEMRGRLGGIAWANVRGGLLLGNVEAGAVAALTTTTISVLTGGLACIVGAGVLAVLLPGFRRYDSRDPRRADVGREGPVGIVG
jgi:MFS family permease